MSFGGGLALKVPPVGVFLFSAVGIWVIQFSFTDLSFGGFHGIAGVFYATGGLAGALGLYTFYKLKTSVDPTNPEKASKLATSGIYRFTRNPMYLGMLLILLGWTIRGGNPLAFLMLIFFVWYMNTYQIKPEETILLKKFGQEYIRYFDNTRRWI